MRAERELDRLGHGAVQQAVAVVGVEHPVDVAPDGLGIDAPQHRVAREPLGGRVGEHLGGDGVEAVVVGGGPGLARADALAGGELQLLGDEALEDAVLDGARGARLDLEHLFGPLGWVDAEDGLEEVATGAGGVVLEGGGRERRAVDRRGQVGQADPALEAVVGAGAPRPALEQPGVHPRRGAGEPVGVHRPTGSGPAGELALVEVALVDGLTGGPHRGGVGDQHPDRGVRREVGQIAGVERAPGVGELRDRVEPPARRPLLAARALVAPGEREHHLGGGGERGEPVAALLHGAVGEQRDARSGGRPVGIGEQGVVGGARGEGPVGGTQDVDDVEVEPHQAAVGTDQQPGAEARGLRGGDSELGHERAHEAGPVGRGVEVVEAGEPLQHRLDRLVRLPFGRRPRAALDDAAEQAAEQLPGPARPVLPRVGRGVGLQQVDDALEEAGQFAGAGRLPGEALDAPTLVERQLLAAPVELVGERGEAAQPALAATRDAGPARQPVGLDGIDHATLVLERGRGQPGHDVVAAPRRGVQVERAQEGPPGQGLGEGAGGRPDDGQPRGGAALVEQGGVGRGGAVGEGDTVERGAGGDARRDIAQGREDLGVGIGRGDGGGGAGHGDELDVGAGGPEVAHEVVGLGVDRRVAGDAHLDHHRGDGTQGPEEGEVVRREPRWQVDHDGARAGDRVASRPRASTAAAGGVARVVVVGQAAADLGREADDVGLAPAAAGQGVEVGRGGLAQGAPAVGDGRLGGGVLGDRRQHARLGARSAARAAAETAVVVSGARPRACSTGPPSSSARWSSVGKRTLARPAEPGVADTAPDASWRRSERPTHDRGTTTVAGARGSAPRSSARRAWSRTAPGRP